MTKYYIIINNNQEGPYTLEELGDKKITSTTPVWHKGMDNWTTAGQLEESKELLDQQPPTPPITPKAPEASSVPVIPPKTWLIESILVTLFCCLPAGVVGIVYASKVETAYNNKQYAEAMQYSRQAKTWTLLSFFIILVPVILYLLFIFFAFIVTGTFSSYSHTFSA